MDRVFATGLAGMLYGFALAEDSSARLARSFLPGSTEDGVQALVDLSTATRQVRASAVVVRTGRQMQDSILDIVA